MNQIAVQSTPIDLDKLRAAHRTGIGGSEVAALFGKSPWRSIHEIWLSKTQEPTDEPATMEVHQELGLALEPGLIDMYLRRRSGITVRPHPELMRHPDHDFLIGHLDGLILGADGKPEGVLEIKTAGVSKGWQWGQEDMEEIPQEYNLQVHHYMAITGLAYAEVVVLIGNYNFRIYRVNRNEELINIIIARCKDFWENYVIPKVAPPIDGSEGAAKMLSRLYPESEEREILADENINKICLAYYETRKKLAELEAEEMAGANQIKEIMKDAAVLSGPGYRITWKQGKERVKVDYQSIVDEVKPPAELIAKHSKTEPGLRSFRPGKLKE